MMRNWISGFTVVCGCCALASCSSESTAPRNATSVVATQATSWTAEDAAKLGALAAYEFYWQLSERAGAAPRARDWRPELTKAMADPALTDYVNEIRNLASVPAHTVGTYARAPRMTSVSLAQPARVIITDCLDATNEHLISDKPGESGRSLDNPDQPRRYEFEAQIVRYPDPDRWLVQLVEPRLEKSC